MSDEMKRGLIVPFGKYKGQPIEVLANDKDYCDFITAQPWFREKFQNHYQVIINNFCEPSETPEHNALQARFLDEDFRLKFATVAIPRIWWYAQANGEMATMAIEWLAKKSIENPKWEIVLGGPEFCGSLLHDLMVPEFEKDGVDVLFSIQVGLSSYIHTPKDYTYKDAILNRDFLDHTFRIEIKPEVGDDYPAILRQMRRNKSVYLFTREYTGAGVTESVFLQFMESQGIRVIFESEVDAAQKFIVEEFNWDEFQCLVKQKIEKTLSPSSPNESLSNENNKDSINDLFQ